MLRLISNSTLLVACGWLVGLKADPIVWSDFPGYQRVPLSIKSQPESNPFYLPRIEDTLGGIDFVNRLDPKRSLNNQILLNGSGVTAGDVNGDGWCDLYFCGLDAPNALYLNLGDWRFERVFNAGGAECSDQSSTGAALADMDGDGDLDLLVTGHRRGVRSFANNGQGTFTETTAAWGLEGNQPGASMALADLDGNGWIDLYVVHYRNDTLRDLPEGQFDIRMKDGRYQLLSYNGIPAEDPRVRGRFDFDRSSGIMENGEPDQLYLNHGNGKLVKAQWGRDHFFSAPGKPASAAYDWGLSAIMQDINGDGAPDLYVCNDFQSPDRFWINQGDGSLLPAGSQQWRQSSLFSMGVDLADVDRNGYTDLFVVDMLSRQHQRRMVQVMDGMAFGQFRDNQSSLPQSPRNTLLMQQPDGRFAELARLADVAASEWSWCPVFIDVDLDGYEDLLITTGHDRDAQHADIARQLDEMSSGNRMSHEQKLASRKAFPRLETPNIAFHNQGDGTFKEVGASWGFAALEVSHGMALADLDNDGDLDVVINALNHPPLIHQNQTTQSRVRVELRGSGGNTQGVGATIEVVAPNLPIQRQAILAGGRYLSSDQPTRTFAVRSPQDRVNIRLRWRDGSTDLHSDLPANHLYRFVQGGSPDRIQDTAVTKPKPLFRDVSDRLPHVHQETDRNGLSSQPMVPRSLDSLGPGITWFDFNQDGWDDLFVGGGRGGQMGVYRNQGGQAFVRQRAKAFDSALPQNQTTLLAWRASQGAMWLMMGQSAGPSPTQTNSGVQAFSMVHGSSQLLPASPGSSPGPLAMADWDGDGDLDLFVGGRYRQGDYPTAPLSQFWENKHGKWSLMPVSESVTASLGMVSAALFSQLAGDPLPELVVVSEWGEMVILENQQGSWNRRPSPMRSIHGNQPSPKGWWTSLTSMDADGDGLMDLVAGNWGLNHERAHPRHQPLGIYYSQGATQGVPGLIETYRLPESRGDYPIRDWAHLADFMPWVGQAFGSFTQLAKSTIQELLDASPEAMDQLQASFFQSVILLNREDHFELHPLPDPIQWSPVFGMGVGDFNGDGWEDLAGSQNFHGVSERDSRQDAGAGFIILGLGDGSFEWMHGNESGILLPGEGRGMAVADFNLDHRPDLAAIQRHAATHLFANQSGQPGLTVELKGTQDNPQAIGARMRLVYRDGSVGPMREIHLGEGYWSQSSATQILGIRSPVKAVEIIWPEGVSQHFPLPEANQRGGKIIIRYPSNS